MSYFCPNCRNGISPTPQRRWFQIVPRTTTATCHQCQAQLQVFARTYAWWVATGVMKLTFPFALVAIFAVALVVGKYDGEPGQILEIAAMCFGVACAAAIFVGISFGICAGFAAASVKRLTFTGEDIVWLLFCIGLCLAPIGLAAGTKFKP